MQNKKTVEVMVGNIGIGGNNPIRVQSMTNTKTANIEATVQQIIELYQAGSELVRFSVKDEADACAVPEIKKEIVKQGYNIPLIGDFHYNGHILLPKFPECAQNLDKYRINPGNIWIGKSHDQNFKTIIKIAVKYDKPIRIGVNFGSLDEELVKKIKKENPQESFADIQIEAMITSAIESAKLAEEYWLSKNKIIIAIKISDVKHLITIYRKLNEKVNYPLHLGLTEAGMGDKGIVATTAALSVLLQEGIGDTIRVSLTPKPNEPRSKEVKVSQLILQTNGIRNFVPLVTSCPGCGRTSSNSFQKLALEITNFLEERMQTEWQNKYLGVENMKVAVMGCIVNGPGESKDANLGISLPGDGENPKIPVYIDGKHHVNLQLEGVADNFKKIIEDYVVYHYQKDKKVENFEQLQF